MAGWLPVLQDMRHFNGGEHLVCPPGDGVEFGYSCWCCLPACVTPPPVARLTAPRGLPRVLALCIARF